MIISGRLYRPSPAGPDRTVGAANLLFLSMARHVYAEAVRQASTKATTVVRDQLSGVRPTSDRGRNLLLRHVPALADSCPLPLAAD
jgi:hypothetical protein